MSKRKRRFVLVLGIALATFIVATSGFCSDKPVTNIIIASGPTGGSWYPLGGVLADIISKDVGIKATVDIGGGVENIKRIDSGADAQVGFGMTPALIDGREGRFPFKKPHKDVRMISYMDGQYVQFIALKKSGIKSWWDLKGKKISPGSKGLGVEVLTQLILKEMGWSYDTITQSGGKVLFFSRDEAISAMRDGRLDANIVTAVYPHPSFEELQLTRDIVLVPMDTKIRAQLIKKYPAYSAFDLPPNVYKNQPKPVPTIMYSTIMICNANLPDQLVYKITKAMFAHMDRIRKVSSSLKRDFSMKGALRWKGIPIHPGAEKYYREAGILK